MINRKNFYDLVRTSLFNGKITSSQLDGMEAVLNEFQGVTGEDISNTEIKKLAYVLATIYHEVAKTMQPIEERGKGKGMRYGKKIRYDNTPYAKPNHIFYGRGLSQTTWIDNYEALTRANNEGWDFVNYPELLLELYPSVWATIHAMETGLYTGKKLSNYFSDKKSDWKNARRIINGQDKANLIADYALKFYAALQ